MRLKKIIALLLCMFMALTGNISTTFSNAAEVNDNKNTDYSFDGTDTLTLHKTVSGVAVSLEDNSIKKKVKKVIIEEGINKISVGQFMNFVNLEEISLPGSLLEIEERAFENCYSLKELVIPSSVSTLGSVKASDAKVGIFSKNYSLRKVVNNSKTNCYLLWDVGSKTDKGLTWKVDKNDVNELKAGETGIAKANTYKIKYKLNKAKIKGKKVSKYTYGTKVSLPSAKKKGYIFVGWQSKSGIIKMIERGSYGDITLKPLFSKIKVKRGKKNTIITVSSISGYIPNIYYNTKKSIKSLSKKNITFGNSKKYNKKSKTYSFKISNKKLKNGKKYYIGVGYMPSESDYGYDEIKWNYSKKFKM